MRLTPEQLTRYSRNIALDGVGLEGQKRICRARVLVVGAGGLGSPAALYLAAAGIGALGLIDPDRVDLENLQRQILHDTASLARRKTDSAAGRILSLNPFVELELFPERLTTDNALRLFASYDFVVDCTDNFPAKFLINDACVLSGKPFSHAGVTGFKGQTLTVVPGLSPCLRCLFDTPPPDGSFPGPSQAGVLGPLAGTFGAIQAAEALKLIAGVGKPLLGKLLSCEALEMKWRITAFSRSESCPVCSTRPAITVLDPGNYKQ